MKQRKSQDIKIVLGDFTSKVGCKKTEKCVGPFGIGVKNERGARLIKWCKQNNLAIMNTWLKKSSKKVLDVGKPRG